VEEEVWNGLEVWRPKVVVVLFAVLLVLKKSEGMEEDERANY
jgi:hypothetical protein